MFTSPSQDFFLAVVPAAPGERSTPPDALRIQFLVNDILKTTRELERRGVAFEQRPQPCQPGSAMYIGFFRTPHGVCVDLWGLVERAPEEEFRFPPAAKEEPSFGRAGAPDAFDEEDSEEEAAEEEQAAHRGYLALEEEDRDTDEEPAEQLEQEENFEPAEPDMSYLRSSKRRFPARFVEPPVAEEDGDEEETDEEPLNFGIEKDEEEPEAEPELEDEAEGDDEASDSEDDDAYRYEYIYEDDL
jgi:hypothetical protein